MIASILVVTSDVPFGDLIRQSLEEVGRFVVQVAGRRESAESFVRENNCSLALLDTSLEGEDILALGRALRHANPVIRFVVISEPGWQVSLEELAPQEYLSKPFYLPDLMEIVDRSLPASPSAPAIEIRHAGLSAAAPDLAWLSDVSRAAQHLTRLTLETSAQAALITRDEQLWAYAGQLPKQAAGELADALARYWDPKDQNDLVRFVRLPATNAEHMLYATSLAPGMVLALAFDAETPFSTIRTQAGQLVHSLSTAPAGDDGSDDAGGDESPLPPISNILADIPSPNPDFMPVAPARLEESIPRASLSQVDRSAPQPASFKQLLATDQASPETIEETLESSVITRKSKPRRSEPAPDDLGETRPSSPVPEVARKIVLEPVSSALYNLDYACLLVPRFTHHHLTGDLSDRLSDLVPQVCVAFGWRLEYISIRPDYLQWIVNVPPASSPGYLMRMLRQHTSERIFAEFPRFKKENPSGDFWAPGYLIMGGSQPPPAQLIKDFITQTRQRQGIPLQSRP